MNSPDEGVPIRSNAPPDAAGRGPAWSVLIFIITAWGVSWCLWLLPIARTLVLTLRVNSHSLRIPIADTLCLLAEVGPAVGALLAIRLFERPGGRGICDLFRRLVPDRQGAKWIAAGLVLPPVLTVCALSVPGYLVPGWAARVTAERWVLLFLVNLCLAPLCEELGWRGFLLPRVQEKLGGVGAALAVGVVWAVWHIPAFPRMVPIGASLGWMALCFFLWVIALSVIVTWIYNGARGNLAAPILFHGSVNASLITFLGLTSELGVRQFAAVTIATWAFAIVLMLSTGRGLLYRSGEMAPAAPVGVGEAE